MHASIMALATLKSVVVTGIRKTSASSNATSKLVVARQLLEDKTKPTTGTDDPQACSPATDDKDWRERLKELTGIDLTICPRCKKGRMVPYPLPSKLRRINLQTRSPPDQS